MGRWRVRRFLRTFAGQVSSEIERKFLVSELPGDLERHRSAAIRQGYVAIEPDGTEVRVRQRGERAELTVKRGAGRTRAEYELELDAGAFARLWPLTEGRRIEKTRYALPLDGGLTVELDVFTGELSGLATAEVEFASEADADAFGAPTWLGREVTDDPRYKNQRLATEGLPGDEPPFESSVIASVATAGSVGVAGSAATAGSVAVVASAATAGSAGVAASLGTAGSVAVAVSAATAGSAGVLLSLLTIFGAGISGCLGTLACVGCQGCVGCAGCIDCVDCVGCVGCVGLRGAVGEVLVRGRRRRPRLRGIHR
jgi:adenylate cyclase